MNRLDEIKRFLASGGIDVKGFERPYPDELQIAVDADLLGKACAILHKRLDSPVMMMFAQDLRSRSGCFALRVVFLSAQMRSWVFVRSDIPADKPEFASMAKEMYSASLFEREIKEMFGIEPVGNPDPRGLKLHSEVWPAGLHPMRKDFSGSSRAFGPGARYPFKRVEGEGVLEIPVGPVHAGIIGPGHFRFSVAGEPIINLEMRLGWTHRGVEKVLEGKDLDSAVKVMECVSGDTAFGYSLAFCQAIEKICAIDVPARAQLIRAICLELERLYNHASDIGGMALDVGFSFPAQFASLVKETILRLNDALSASRYLKGVNIAGGTAIDIDHPKAALVETQLAGVEKDFDGLEEMLFSSVSFMDRVDATGILRVDTARNLGITGLAARASGIGMDMRKIFPSIYGELAFVTAKARSGDVAARLKVRCVESKESIRIIRQCLKRLEGCPMGLKNLKNMNAGSALGYAEAWRGPALVWVSLDEMGLVERCKIVDPSFHNWDALSYAVLGNIVPDFPLCNKSFDLSYSGNDL